MKKTAKMTEKATNNLASRFGVEFESERVVEEVRIKIEEKLNLGDYEEWMSHRGARVVVAISAMRFVCIEKRVGFYVVTTALTQDMLDRLARSSWFKSGEAGAVVERGKPLRSMPFAALAKLAK